MSDNPLHKRFFRFVDYLYIQYSYMIRSRLSNLRLNIPEGKKKGIVLSFDVETWRNRCAGRVEPSADPEDEYFRYLPDLLDILRDYSVLAQFFVCGKVLDLYPEVFREVLRERHSIGGHGYNHERMHTLSCKQQRCVVRKVMSLLRAKYGVSLKSWRCPGLAANRETYRALNEFGVKVSSNAPWGNPMLIEGVIEIPIVRKMDDEILENGSLHGLANQMKWAHYMEKTFASTDKQILVFGMHTWVQRKYDAKNEALTCFLNLLESYRDDVWFGSLEDFC